MRRILLKIEYDGSSFYGWQKQPNMRTVQGEIENAIQKITSKHCEVFASGRTDAGVHALGQSAHFDLDLPIPISKLADILNNLLPDDIAIKKAEIVPDDFHARFSIKSKCYEYRVYNSAVKNALISKHFGIIKEPLDLELMRQASKIFLGEHDFKGYCSSATITSDYHRTIFDIDITKKKDIVYFTVQGNGFLYKMVRIIVGTLIDIGRGKLSINSAQKALDDGNRALAGFTMSASGLYLKYTQY